ncbi:MAG TPA: BamA/TamA family outer membrane protein [Fimbriimonadaceae bacterium]|nr:BamA/TamA family outer membrane protein [Fimbriimonadaceae bacterium]
MRALLAVIFMSFCVLGSAQEVEILGAHHVSEVAIKGALAWSPEQVVDQAWLAAAKLRIERMGFFRSVALSLEPKGTGHEVRVQVEEYPEVAAIDVIGNKAITSDAICMALDIEIGKIFNSNGLVERVKRVRELYSKKSYFGDVLTLDFDPEKPTHLRVEIVEMTVNSVVPYGNQRTKSDAILRLIYTQPGEPFNRDRWIGDLRRLQATHWFEDVHSYSRESSLGKIDLMPTFKEAKTGEWTAGVSAEPGSPVVGTFGIAESNWKGTGQSIAFKGSQGVHTQGPTLEVNYGNPFFTSDNVALGVSIYTRNSYRFAGLGVGSTSDSSDEGVVSERRTGATFGVSKSVSENSIAQLSLRVEDVQASRILSGPGITRQNGALASLLVGFVRSRRDVDIDPSRGDWLRLGLEPGYSRITQLGGSLTGAAGIGDHTYMKSTAEYRTYWSPDKRESIEDIDKPARTVALRVRYGSIFGSAPFSEQFFVGGTDSVRGYSQDRFWGSQMLLGTLEYRHPLSRDWGLIGFMDYGGAWGGYGGIDDFTQSRKVDLHFGYGFGLGYRMPRVGPLRIDFGFDSSGKMRSHFQISTPF